MLNQSGAYNKLEVLL